MKRPEDLLGGDTIKCLHLQIPGFGALQEWTGWVGRGWQEEGDCDTHLPLRGHANGSQSVGKRKLPASQSQLCLGRKKAALRNHLI